MSINSVRWKLPSPTWPTIGAMMRVSAISACVAVTQSASREIGTQTSVATIAAPGRSLKFANAALWRASHNLVRSSGLRRPDERAAAQFLGDFAKPFRLFGNRRRRCREIPSAAGLFPAGSVFDARLRARTCKASSNSMRATGMPAWMVMMAALQAASTDGNGQRPPEIASGMPDSLSVNSVMMPSVPSEPIISRVRS